MARGGQVEFFYRANVGDVVRAEQHLVHSAQRLEGSLQRVARTQGAMHTQFNKLFRSVGYGITSYLGVVGIMNTVNRAVSSLGETLQNRYDFEKTMTPLLSLGDNSKGIGAINRTKREVLGLSSAYGVARDEIADFLFWSQSSGSGIEAGTLLDLQRESLELAKAAGGAPMDAVNLLTKAYRVFGDEISSVNQLQEIMFTIQERGATTFTDMAQLLPNVMSAAEKVGLTLPQLGALIITATQKQGRNEIAVTGTRSFLASLIEAADKGVKLTGDIYENLRQLQDLTAREVLKLGGREALPVITALAESVDDIRKNAEYLESIGPMSNIVGGKIEQRLGDVAYVDAEIKKRQEQAKENISLTPGARTELVESADLAAGYTKTGLKTMFPEYVTALFDSGFLGIAAQVGDVLLGGPFRKRGMEFDLAKLRDAGLDEELEKTLMRQGSMSKDLDRYAYADKAIDRVTTTPEWATEEAYKERREKLFGWMWKVPDIIPGMDDRKNPFKKIKKGGPISMPGHETDTGTVWDVLGEKMAPLKTFATEIMQTGEYLFNPPQSGRAYWERQLHQMRKTPPAAGPSMITPEQASQMYSELYDEYSYAQQLGMGQRKTMRMGLTGEVERYAINKPGEEYAASIPARFVAKYGQDAANQLGTDPNAWLEKLYRISTSPPGTAPGTTTSVTGPEGSSAGATVSAPGVEGKIDETNALLKQHLDRQQPASGTRAAPMTGADRGTKEVVGARR